MDKLFRTWRIGRPPSRCWKLNGASYGPSLAAIAACGLFDFHPALEPGVGVYVDDVYYSTLTGSIVDLLDIERVEVLRGPQGTLAGKNSIGGAIKLYSRRPTGDGTGYLSATYGSRDRMDLKGEHRSRHHAQAVPCVWRASRAVRMGTWIGSTTGASTRERASLR